MNQKLTQEIFGLKRKEDCRNYVMSKERPNPNSFFKNILGEDKSKKKFYPCWYGQSNNSND